MIYLDTTFNCLKYIAIKIAGCIYGRGQYDLTGRGQYDLTGVETGLWIDMLLFLPGQYL